MANTTLKLTYVSLMIWIYVKLSDGQLAFSQEMVLKGLELNHIKTQYRQNGANEHSFNKTRINNTKNGISTDTAYEHLVNNPKNATFQPECSFEISQRSLAYFQTMMHISKPNFIQFGLRFNEAIINQSVANDVFKPKHWFWTYSTPAEMFPYLSWNLDYSILSFNLLDTKTIEVQYVQLNVQNNPCFVKFGSLQTTRNIVNALTKIVNVTDDHRYDINLFCFLSKDLSINRTLEFKLALYFGIPVTYISYHCCYVSYNFVNETFVRNCTQKPMEKWNQCLVIPYILGVIIFLYSPIPFFKISACIASGEKLINTNDLDVRNDFMEEDLDDVENWIYLDGNTPVTILDIFTLLSCNLNEKLPLLTSRFRRICVLLIGPLIIYIQLYMYKDGMGVGTQKIFVQDLAKAGTPMGFLSLLADYEDRHKLFVPLLGGPVSILIMYHVIGFMIIVLPKSVKQIVESGLPRSKPISDCDVLIPISPFCFSASDITLMSMARLPTERGYKKAATMFEYSIYMLFTNQFWKRLIAIQRQRLNLGNTDQSKTTRYLKLAFLPLIIISCLAESILCVAFYAVPLFNFVVIMVRGSVRELLNVRTPRNRPWNVFLRNPVTIFLGFIVVFLCFVLFAYSFCLIFVNSFCFVVKVVAFCFVAVIIYPSVSFGYLFFFVVLLYYLVRLIRNFGDCYLELLSIAVERSMDIENNINSVTVIDDELVVSNIRVQSFKNIKMNDCVLNIPQNTIQAIQNNTTNTCRTRKRGNVYGIPGELFSDLVKEFRPMHIRFLKIVLHLALIVVLITVILSITSKFVASPSSEISDVMHVIFLVVVGALPRILELALVNESKVVKKETESRAIEQSIMTYWNRKNVLT